jgi:hypothetical protein
LSRSTINWSSAATFRSIIAGKRGLRRASSGTVSSAMSDNALRIVDTGLRRS